MSGCARFRRGQSFGIEQTLGEQLMAKLQWKSLLLVSIS
jgi:hypothetical protein